MDETERVVKNVVRLMQEREEGPEDRARGRGDLHADRRATSGSTR